jgi:hypothetical protein
MNATRDPDQILHAWLEEGPTVLPAPTVRAIEIATRATAQQRRAFRLPWRPYPMPFPTKLLGVAAVVAVLLIGGALLLGPRDQRSVGGPSATASPTAEPTASPSPALESFTSPLYGYSIQHPASWRSTPATERWTAGLLVMPDVPYTDTFHPQGTTLGAAVSMAAQPIPEGTSAAVWMSDWARFREETGGACFGPASDWTDATVGGVRARRLQAPCDFAQAGQADFVEYAWVVDGSGFVVTGTPSVVDLMVGSFEAP